MVHLTDISVGWSTLTVDAAVDQIAAVASRPDHVFIVGAADSAERLARTVHALSARREKPLVWFDGRSLPEAVIHSELLGHEAGSFCGAFRSYRGRVWRADGGTLAIIASDGPTRRLRAALSRCAESGAVWPLGARSAVGRVDVRIIAISVRRESATIA